MCIAIIFVAATSSLADDGRVIIRGSRISIYQDENDSLKLGRDGHYMVRFASVTPTKYYKIVIDSSEVDVFASAIKKAVDWCEINKQEKMSFEKELYSNKYKTAVVTFVGSPSGCSVAFDLKTSNVSEYGGNPDDYELFSEDKIRLIHYNLSKEKHDEYKNALSVKRSRDELNKKAEEAESIKEKNFIDSKFK